MGGYGDHDHRVTQPVYVSVAAIGNVILTKPNRISQMLRKRGALGVASILRQSGGWFAG